MMDLFEDNKCILSLGIKVSNDDSIYSYISKQTKTYEFSLYYNEFEELYLYLTNTCDLKIT